MRRRQHTKDGLKPPCVLHLIPSDVYLSSHCIRVDHHRLDEALRSLEPLGRSSYIVSADYRPAPGSGYGYIKSYVVAITGLPLSEAQARFTDMPSRHATPVQYRVVDILSVAIQQVRSSGKPYRREVVDPARNTSYLTAQEILGATTIPMSTIRRMPQASTLLNLIRQSDGPFPSRDLERVSGMDYVLEADVRTASDLVRFIGGNDADDVTVNSY